jgi:hypothetical protein
MKLRSVFVLCVAVLASAVALPAEASCDNYECKRSVDTAQCYIRYGPTARTFQLGSECREVANCGWYFEENVWDVACSYDCQITQCYEV